MGTHAWAAKSDLEKYEALHASLEEMERRVEDLRLFEREYRSRLKAYLEGLARDLDGEPDPAPSTARVGREWASVAGQPVKARLVSSGGENDGAFAWIEVAPR